MTEGLYAVEPGESDLRAGVLINALTGSMDAGNVARLVAAHLTTALPVTRVATFDADELVDYRGRRPTMTFEEWRFTDIAEPQIVLDRLRDDEGVPVLLLHGPEPDLRWDGFTRAVIDLVERFGVERTVSVHGVPMGVPHTRPTTVLSHATDLGLIRHQPHLLGTVQVPGSVSGMLELRLGQAGHEAVGFAANIPHYLAQSEFPQGAAELVRQVARNTELALPVGDLEAAASEIGKEIERQVADSAEVGAIVKALEKQFDAFLEGPGKQDRAALLAEPVKLPTAEEIGEELEAFLADQLVQGTDAGPPADEGGPAPGAEDDERAPGTEDAADEQA